MSEIAKVETPQVPADPMVSMIERLATDPNSDLAKLEKMLEMKERIDSQNAMRAFADAMAACQAEMEPVARNKRNDQTSSNYADLAAIYKECKPIAAKHGLSFSTFPAPSEMPDHVGIDYTIRHSSGHEKSGHADVPLDDRGMKGTVNKTKTHAFGSTLSYGRRYLFCMVFDIATGDDRDGNKPADTITPEQFAELTDLIEKAGVTVETVCQANRIEILEEMPAANFEKVRNKLAKTIEAKARAE